jgi:L-lactate dehydrogenase complex protein LldG
MSDKQARTAIVSRVRTALGANAADGGRAAAVERRIAHHSRGTVPALTPQDGKALAAYLGEKLESAGAEFQTVGSADEAIRSITSYMAGHGLPPRLRMGSDPVLANLPWDLAPLTIETGPARATDRLALSRAVAGAAETGTLFLISGQHNPTTLNFLPENHVVLIRSEDIFGAYEDAWDTIRRLSGRALPRTVNLISGPSQTADIEQTIIRGAHGPKRLFVLILA